MARYTWTPSGACDRIEHVFESVAPPVRKSAASTGVQSPAGDLTTAVGAVLDRLGTLVRQADDLAPTVRTVELLDAVAALEHAQTLVALAQAKVLAALTVVEPLPYQPGNGLTAAVRLHAEETTAHEVAATLRCSVSVARDRLATAGALAGVSAAVSAATDGSLRWWQLRRTADAVVTMPAAARAEVDRRIAEDAAAGRCASRFSARLTRAVVAADPAHADARHDESVADRRVTVRPVDSGMAWFGACVAAEDALTIGRCLDELADTEPGGRWTPVDSPAETPGASRPDVRTLDQRRADALVGLARTVLDDLHAAGVGRRANESGGAPSGRRRGARRRAEVQLVVSAETVLGISDAPGDLGGYGPVGPAQARRIAHLAGTTWRRVLTDPATGVVLDRGRTAYAAAAPLAEHVRVRFGGRCTRPGCPQAGADLDHATAWQDGGTTGVGNLHPVCRGCHTAKHTGWTVRIDRDGTTTWATPHGRSASTHPTDLRPEDRVRTADPPLPAHERSEVPARRAVRVIRDRSAESVGHEAAWLRRLQRSTGSEPPIVREHDPPPF